MTSSLMFRGMSAEAAFTAITDTGVSSSDASRFLAAWIYENLGHTLRTFNYLTDFPAVDPDCQVPEFTRQLQHADWVDGESTVQAQATTGEDGFNKRFHDIEADVDQLAADVAKSYACVAEMRADLSTALLEIRDELNRLNADVFDLSTTGSGISPTSTTGGLAGQVSSTTSGLISTAGQEYVTTTKFLDKYVQLFRGADGSMTMLPAIEQSVVNPAFDPRVARTAKLGRFVSSPEVHKRFSDNFTLDQFVETFGDAEVGGISVTDLVAILPPGSTFSSLDDLVGDVAVREGAALRTSDTGITAVVNAFGLDVDVTSVAEAPIERYAAIPKDARVALAANGVGTLAGLVEGGSERVVGILKKERISATAADAAEWVAGARALTAVG